MNDRNTFRNSPAPKVLANRGMRSLLLTTATVGVVNVTVQLLTTGFVVTLTTAWGWLFASVTAIMGYRNGVRPQHAIGRWIAYPVDEAGVPTAPPMTGQLLMDDDR